MFGQIAQIQQEGFNMEQLQKNILGPVNNLFSKNPTLDGVLLKDIPLVSTKVNQVQTKLSRAYQGYIITKLNANSVIWVANSEQPNLYVNLNCSTNCVVDIWVF